MHLLAIPMGTLSHTASNYADLVLDVLFSLGGDALLRKLIGITSDGAATMLGCRQDFAIRMRRASERVGGGGVAVRWCGSHQLNLAIGAFLDCLDKFVRFRSCLGAEISFTRTFETVRATVGQCPTYSTTRWESIYDTCKFLAINYQELKRLKAEKKQKPSSCSWWLCLFVVSDVAELVRHCFKTMQYKTATMKVQYDALTALARSLQLKFERDLGDGEQIGVVVDNVKIAQHLCTASLYSVELYRSLDTEQQEELVDKVATALSGLIESVTKIKIEIGTEASERCPETPLEVMQCDDTTFRDLIERHKSRLTTSYGITAANDIWQQRMNLSTLYQQDSTFRRRVDGDMRLPFDALWSAEDLEHRFTRLASFLAGLAAISPGTHSVEGEFSVLKQIKNAQRSSTSNYAIEGQLQAKQYFELLAMVGEVSTKVDTVDIRED